MWESIKYAKHKKSKTDIKDVAYVTHKTDPFLM
jgi:hypothetical protein